MPSYKAQTIRLTLILNFPIVLFFAYFLCLFYGKSLSSSEQSKNLKYSVAFYDEGITRLGEIISFNHTLHLAKDNSQSSLLCLLSPQIDQILNQKDKNGIYLYANPDGQKWDVNIDELKIYTSINKDIQLHAVAALTKQLIQIQPEFSKQINANKYPPFDDQIRKVNAAKIMLKSQHDSKRHHNMTLEGYSTKEINTAFITPRKMTVFSHEGTIDTLLSPNDSIFYYKKFLRASLVSIEPKSGYVKAWVEGPEFCSSSSNPIRKRQIGSLMKSFVYGVALDMNVVDPCEEFTRGKYCVGSWCPGGIASGRLTENLIYHQRSAAIPVLSKMGEKRGPQELATHFRRMLVLVPKNYISPVLGLGILEMSILQATSAHTVFANNGVFVSPSIILKIEDKNGNVIYRSTPKQQKILDENSAYSVLLMLKQNIVRGTCSSLKNHYVASNVLATIAGKSGNTQSFTDAWFVGLTPDLVTGVWVGGEDRSIHWKSSSSGLAEVTALPVFGYFMKKLNADSTNTLSTRDFVKPKNFPDSWLQCIALNKNNELTKIIKTNPFL